MKYSILSYKVNIYSNIIYFLIREEYTKWLSFIQQRADSYKDKL